MIRFGSTFFTERLLRKNYDLIKSESFRLNEQQKKSENTTYDIFLSHSSKDKIIVLNFIYLLEGKGYKIYVDWINDSDIGRDKICEKLKIAMKNSTVLLYLHTHNSKNSKWTPWEIGYFDCLKSKMKIGIMPILNDENQISTYLGQEYLTIYNEIGIDKIFSFITLDL